MPHCDVSLSEGYLPVVLKTPLEMTICSAYDLEEIDIAHRDSEWNAVTLRSLELCFENPVEFPARNGANMPRYDV